MHVEQSTAASVMSVFAPKTNQPGSEQKNGSGSSRSDDGDIIEISKAGQTAAAVDAFANGRASSFDLRSFLGDTNGDGKIELRELQAHVDRLMATAEQGLKRLASEHDVDLNNVTIRSDGSGKIVVEGDDPNAAKLEAAINEDHEVRNALIGAESTATILRIGKAVSMAYNAAESNPSGADGYYAWARSIAEQTKAMDMEFSFVGGKLTSGFETADGRRMGIFDGLRESARAAGLPDSAIG
ncbi:MAG: hypothetical protein MI741_02730 [Rhodospirillales bacterium]|nr:hypothetical protein [Rhodospirillales bacterium]